jgi:hypothetical protein
MLGGRRTAQREREMSGERGMMGELAISESAKKKWRGKEKARIGSDDTVVEDSDVSPPQFNALPPRDSSSASHPHTLAPHMSRPHLHPSSPPPPSPRLTHPGAPQSPLPICSTPPFWFLPNIPCLGRRAAAPPERLVWHSMGGLEGRAKGGRPGQRGAVDAAAPGSRSSAGVMSDMRTYC